MSLETADNNSSRPNKPAGGEAAARRIATHGFKALAVKKLSVPPDQTDGKQQLVLCSFLYVWEFINKDGKDALKHDFLRSPG